MKWIRRIATGAAPIALLSTIWPMAANAQKAVADTPFLLLGSDKAASESIVKRDDAIVSTRMVYALIASADDDVRGVDGKVIGASPLVLAPKGAQLFGVVARGDGHKVYCAIDHKPKGALEGVFVINADKHTCFIDNDNDGRFDRSYDLRTKFSPLIPIYYDIETVGNPLKAPIGYSVLAPEQCQMAMWLDIFVQKISAGGKSATIGVRMRTDKSSVQFVYTKRLDLTAGDRTFEVLGARIVVSPRDEKTVSARIVRGIARQEFSTERPDQRIVFIAI